MLFIGLNISTTNCLSKASDKIENHLQKAQQLKSRNNELAMMHLDSLLLLDYARPKAWFLKGKIHFEQDQLIYAGRSFERALRYCSTNPEYYAAYADVLMQEGKDSTAILYLQRAHHMAFEEGTAPQQSLVLTKLGQYYSAQKEPDTADSLLVLALQYDNSNKEAQQTLRLLRGPGGLGINFRAPLTWLVLGPLFFLLIASTSVLIRWRKRIKEQRAKLESARRLYADIFEDDLARYDILQELRRSSVSSVYKAWDKKLNRPVAIKIIHLEDMATDAVLKERIARFRLEAQVVAQLDHPNIVRLYDYNESQNGYYYMVMEFVQGKTLKHVIDQHETMTLADKVRIVKEICLALHEAHQQRILHRDIKPSNAMLNEHGTAKVLDFGLAKLQALTNASILTMTGVLVGTPMYMAPEQIRSQYIDERVDIYSLGVTFYELLSGLKPFSLSEDDSSYKLFSTILNDEPPKLPSLIPSIPPALAGIVEKMMAKSPEKRFSSVHQVYDYLTRLQPHE